MNSPQMCAINRWSWGGQTPPLSKPHELVWGPPPSSKVHSGTRSPFFVAIGQIDGFEARYALTRHDLALTSARYGHET